MNLEALKKEVDKVLTSEFNTFLNLKGKLKDLKAGELETLITYIAETLPQLEDLKLDGNGLTEIPENIAELKNLKLLNLANNNLKQLPEAIGALDQLWYLKVSGNGLASLPNNIGTLPHLTDLELSNNALSVLPESLGQLENLKRIDISNNPNIETLPEPLYTKYANQDLKIKREQTSNVLQQNFETYEKELLALKDAQDIERALEHLKTHVSDNEVALAKVKATLEQLNAENISFTTGNGLHYNASQVINDFFTKFPKEEGIYQPYFDSVVKDIIALSKLENTATAKDLLAGLAVPLGNCNTPVFEFILEATITANKNNPDMAPLVLRMAVKEKISEEFTAKLTSIDTTEIIEKINALVNSVLLEDAEDLHFNHLKITGDRLYAPSASDHVGAMDYFKANAYKSILKGTAKLFCKTDKKGRLIKDNNNYVIDPAKLEHTLNVYLFKKNRLDEITSNDPNFIKKLETIEHYKEHIGRDTNAFIDELDKKYKMEIYDTSVEKKLTNYLSDIQEELSRYLINKKDLKKSYSTFKNKTKTKLKAFYKEAKSNSNDKKANYNVFRMMSRVPKTLKAKKRRGKSKKTPTTAIRATPSIK